MKHSLAVEERTPTFVGEPGDLSDGWPVPVSMDYWTLAVGDGQAPGVI
jgi:hypothetical protein